MLDRSLVSFRSAATSLVWAIVLAAFAAGCSSKSSSPSAPAPQSSGNGSVAEQPAPPNSLELVFTYGSEKQKWIEEVTAAFNAAGHKLADGRVVFVRAYPMGSGECIDEILTGRRQAHLTSPASAAYLTLGNAQSRAKTGKALVASTQNLVLSPVVIAMWRPMAEASVGARNRSVGRRSSN